VVAARAADGGASLEAVRSKGELVLARVRLWATLERLDYLRRSGRVPAVAAFATNALDLHPVFRFVDGSPTPVTAPRGVRRAAERVLRAWMESTPDDASRAHVIIFHAARDQDAEDMRRRVLDRDPNTEVSVVHIKAAMAAHVGPGILGLAWWWE
jgi:DegV family protein with EDD domain